MCECKNSDCKDRGTLGYVFAGFLVFCVTAILAVIFFSGQTPSAKHPVINGYVHRADEMSLVSEAMTATKVSDAERIHIDARATQMFLHESALGRGRLQGEASIICATYPNGARMLIAGVYEEAIESFRAPRIPTPDALPYVSSLDYCNKIIALRAEEQAMGATPEAGAQTAVQANPAN